MQRRHFLSLCVCLGALSSGAAAQSEPETKTILPLKEMVAVITSQKTVADKSFYYDPGFKAVGSFAVHNHFAQRVCLGYLLTDGETLSYRYIRAWPGIGSSNDAFQVPLSNIARVEYKYYKASRGLMDAYPERLSVEFFFEDEVKGLVADWKKKDMKFDIWDVAFGYTLMNALKERKVQMKEKN